MSENITFDIVTDPEFAELIPPSTYQRAKLALRLKPMLYEMRGRKLPDNLEAERQKKD